MWKLPTAIHTIFKFQIQHYGSSDLEGTWFAGQDNNYSGRGSAIIFFCILPLL
jgi:hypothetical protein